MKKYRYTICVSSKNVEHISKVKNYSIISDEPSIVRNDNNSYDVVFKLKFTPTGDVNDDGEFNVSDAVLLLKWLLSLPDTHSTLCRGGILPPLQ